MLTAERAPPPQSASARHLPDDAQLREECGVFCRLLAGERPTAYVLSSYVRGHGRIPYLSAGDPVGGEAMLLGFARWGVLPARMADAYSRFFYPISPLRQKLVLLLAILETTPPYHTRLNTSEVGSFAGVATRLLFRGMGFALLLGVSIALLGIPDLLAGMLHRPRRTPG